MITARHADIRSITSRLPERSAILAVVVTALLFASVFPIRTYLSTRSQLEQLSREAQLLERTNARLQRRIDRLHQSSYLEQLARRCLGMVKRGEVQFAIVPSGSHPNPASC